MNTLNITDYELQLLHLSVSLAKDSIENQIRLCQTPVERKEEIHNLQVMYHNYIALEKKIVEEAATRQIKV